MMDTSLGVNKWKLSGFKCVNVEFNGSFSVIVSVCAALCINKVLGVLGLL